MTTKKPRRTSAELDKINDQLIDIGADIGIVGGRLGRKGMYTEEDEIMQRYEDISEKYCKKLHVLNGELDLIGKDNRSPKNAFAAIIINSIFPVLRSKKRTKRLSDRDSLLFYAKINEIVRVVEERNQTLSRFLTEISERYDYIASLPDVPIPEERREKALRDIGRKLIGVSEEHQNDSPFDVTTDNSAKGKPIKQRINSR